MARPQSPQQRQRQSLSRDSCTPDTYTPGTCTPEPSHDTHDPHERHKRWDSVIGPCAPESLLIEWATVMGYDPITRPVPDDLTPEILQIPEYTYQQAVKQHFPSPSIPRFKLPNGRLFYQYRAKENRFVYRLDKEVHPSDPLAAELDFAAELDVLVWDHISRIRIAWSPSKLTVLEESVRGLSLSWGEILVGGTRLSAEELFYLGRQPPSTPPATATRPPLYIGADKIPHVSVNATLRNLVHWGPPLFMHPDGSLLYQQQRGDGKDTISCMLQLTASGVEARVWDVHRSVKAVIGLEGGWRVVEDMIYGDEERVLGIEQMIFEAQET